MVYTVGGKCTSKLQHKQIIGAQPANTLAQC